MKVPKIGKPPLPHKFSLSIDPSGSSSRYEEIKDERGDSRLNHASHPASSINEEHNSWKENYSLMIPKYK